MLCWVWVHYCNLKVVGLNGHGYLTIKLNNKELRSLTQQTLFKDYTRDNNYEHIPTNYKDHPEFGISLEHTIEQLLDNHKLSISVYFNLENKPFMIEIVNKRPL